jgi:chemotaxis protein MotA
MIMGGISPHQFAELMDEDLNVHHEIELRPSAALQKLGDALPGLGIVAAVLGIVITMGHLDGGAEEIGHHVAASLVGTFLGILLCYGVMQPLATNVEMQGVAESKYFACLKEGLLAALRGASPMFAVEFARKALFSDERPSGAETEAACKELKNAAPAAPSS